MLSRHFALLLIMRAFFGLSQGARCNDSLIALLDSTRVNEEQTELRLRLAREFGDTDTRSALEYAREALRYAEEINDSIAHWPVKTVHRRII